MSLDTEFEVKLKGIDESSPAFKKAMESAQLAIKASQAFNAAISEQSQAIQKNNAILMQADKAYQKTGKSVHNVSVMISNNVSSMEKSQNTAIGLAGAFNLITDTVNDMIGIFQALTDEKFLRKLSDILQILSTIARFKGAGGMADFLKRTSNQVEDLADIMSKFSGDTGTIFNDLASKAIILERALAIVKFAMISLPVVAIAAGTTAMAINMGLLTKQTAAVTDKVLIMNKSWRNFGDAMKTKAVPGFVGVVEKAAIAGTIMTTLGFILKESENQFVSLTGVILVAAGIALAGFTAATGFVIKKIGELSVAIGIKLFESMANFEKLAMKAESTMKAFSFTIEAFGEQIGIKFIGSLEKWNALTNRIVDSTIYMEQEIQKAITFVISEAPALGLIPDQMEKILTGAADVAASSGHEFIETVKAIVKGLSGNTEAVFNLGINMRDAALAHSEFASEVIATRGALTDEEKVLARLQIAQHRFDLVQGAAAEQTKTIAGATAIYEKRLNDLQTSLGEAGILTRELIRLKANLLNAFINLPKPIIDATGAIQDFLAVFLIVTGTFIQIIVPLGAAITAFKVFSHFVTQGSTLSLALAEILTVLSTSMGGQVIAVNSASTAWAGFITVTKLAIKNMAIGLLVALIEVTKYIGMMSKAILMNPLFRTAVVIAAGIFLVSDAFGNFNRNLEEANKHLIKNGKIVKEAKKEIGFFENAWIQTKNIMAAVGRAISAFVTLLMTGLAKALGIVIFYLKSASLWLAEFLGMDDDVRRLSKEMQDIADNFELLGLAGDKAISDIAVAFQDVEQKALAAEKAHEKYLESIEYSAVKAKELAKVLGEIDQESLKIEIMGNEFQAVAEQIFKIRTELNKATDRFDPLNEKAKEQRENISKLTEDLIRAQLGLRKMVQDSTKDIENQLKNIQKQKIQEAGESIRIIEMERDEQLEALEEVRQKLKSVGAFGKAQQDVFEQLTLGIKEIAQAKIGTEKIEALKKAQAPLLKQLEDLNKETAKLFSEQDQLGKSQEEIIKLERDLALARADALKIQLEAAGLSGRVVDEQIAQFKASINKAADIKIDELEIPFTFGDMADEISAAFEGMDLQKSAADFSIMMDDITGEDLKNGMIAAFDTSVTFLKDKLRGISVKGFLKGLGSGILQGIQGAGKLLLAGAEFFSPQSINRFSDSLGDLQNLPNNMISAFTRFDGMLNQFISNFPKAAENFVARFPELIDKIIQKIPAVIDAILEAAPKIIASIAEKLPEIARMLMQAMAQIFARADEFLVPLIEAIPRIFEAILQELPNVITSLLEKLPIIFQEIVAQIPEIVRVFADNIGPIVESLVEGLIVGAGDIAIALIDEMIAKGGIIRIAESLIKAMPRIAQAFVVGVINGLAEFLSNIGDYIFGGVKTPKFIEDFPEKIQESVNKLSTKISRETSKLFKVLELEQNARGIETAQKIGDAIKQAAIYFEIKFKGLLGLLKDAWLWVWNNIILKIWDKITEAWIWVRDEILMKIWNWVTEAWMWVKENILDKLAGIVSGAWQHILDFFNNLKTTIETAFDYVKKYIIDPIKKFKEAVEKIFEGPIWITTFAETVRKLTTWKPPSLDIGGGGDAWGSAGHKYLRHGGIIGNDLSRELKPLYAQLGLLVPLRPRGLDTVPIMAQPGEAIISRESTKANIGLVSQMLDRPGEPVGSMGPAVVNNYFNFEKTMMNPDQIRREVVPAVSGALKRMSQNGRRVLSPAGVRD